MLASGENFYAVTGGGYSPPCQNGGGDPTEGGRFSKGAKAVAMFPLDTHFISGHVFVGCPGHTCGPRKGVPGVTIKAHRPGSKKAASATTWSNGAYELAIHKKGTWTVTPSGLDALYKPRKRTVDLNGNRSGVDFSACGGRVSSVISKPVAATEVTPGTYSNKLNPVGDDQCVAHLTFFVTVSASHDVDAELSVNPFKYSPFSFHFVHKNAPVGQFFGMDATGVEQGFLRIKIDDGSPTKVEVQRASGHHQFGRNTGVVYHATRDPTQNTFDLPPLCLATDGKGAPC
jgi:hypothetical protein